MYRHKLLLGKYLSRTILTSLSRHECGAVVPLVAKFSALTRQHGIKDQPQQSYSRLKYWCENFGKNKQFERFVNLHLSKRTATSNPSEFHKCSECVNNVFEKYHQMLQSGSLSPDCVVHFALSLMTAVYSGLAWLPWLSNNHIIAFIQILMNEKIEDILTKPLYSQKHFRSIYDFIDQHASEIPKTDCPAILLSLIYSGLDRHDRLVHKMLSHCYEAAPYLNVNHLRDLTYVFQSLGGRNFALAEKVVSRIDDIFDGRSEVDFEVEDMCSLQPIMAPFMSQGLTKNCSIAVLKKLQDKSPHLDILTIGCCFRFSRKMRNISHISCEIVTQIRFVGKEALDNMEDFGHLQSYHIADICSNARKLGFFMGDLVGKLQDRSLQLLQEGKSTFYVRDITNLLYAFSKDASPSLKEEVSQLLVQHMEDTDVLTLSNIAEIIQEMALNDSELITAFQGKVLQNINNIFQYMTRLTKVLRMLCERMDYDVEFNQKMSASLLKQLERNYGCDHVLMIVCSQFLLASARSIVPVMVMDSLLHCIPRCNLKSLLILLQSLERIKGPRSRILHKQQFEIRSKIQQNIGKLIKNATYARELAGVIKSFHIETRQKDVALLENIMCHYPNVSKNMNIVDYLKTLYVFRFLPHTFYQPQVFEDLITFTKENHHQLNMYSTVTLVTILSNAAYHPQHYDDFVTFTQQMLTEAMEGNNYLHQIRLAHSLSVMTIFPNSILGNIFSIDYLERLDSVISAGRPDGHRELSVLLMHLNRSVFLECPDLDVPWFHHDFCEKLVENHRMTDFGKTPVLVEETKQALTEVLKGEEFFGHNVYSPYFHPIDFEIVLNAAGNLVPYSAAKLLNPDELGYERVALILVTNKDLCFNSDRRRGKHLRKLRHLEILGYRVEEVCRYDWNSMALLDWKDKVEFLRSKIFPNGKNYTQLGS